MMKGWRYPCAVVLVGLLMVSLTVCRAGEPIELGFVGGLTGRVADLGISGRNGALLAVEDRNRKGGVLGRPVRLVIKDDGQDVEIARRVVGELIDRNVAAIIGHMTSTMSAATLPLVNAHETVMISPTTTTGFLSGRDDYFFRVVSSSRSYATMMADYLLERGIDRVAVIYDLRNEVYTQSWLIDFRAIFGALGGAVVDTFSFYSGSGVHFFPLTGKALKCDSEALLILASAMDTAMLAQQVRKMDREILLLAAEWAATEKLIEFGGPTVKGMILSQYFDPRRADPDYLVFREKYIERFAEPPGFASVGAYDAVNVVLDAMEAKRPNESLKESILRLSDFRGVQGLFIFDRYGDAVRRTFLTVVRDGEFLRLE